MEIHYNEWHREFTPHGGGASEGCRPKLPRWPFSGSSCTQASGTALHGSMVGSQVRRVKLFVHRPRIFGAPRAESFVVTLLPPASFLTPFPTDPSSSHRLSLCQHRLCRTPRQLRIHKNQPAKEKKIRRASATTVSWILGERGSTELMFF